MPKVISAPAPHLGWPHRPGIISSLAEGQIIEWLVWSRIAWDTGGRLHLFLPMLDVGIDGMARRVSDGRAVALQVKGATHLQQAGYMRIMAHESSVAADGVLMLFVWLQPALMLGPYAYLMSTGEFRDRAERLVVGRETMYGAHLRMDREDLGERWGDRQVTIDAVGPRLSAFLGPLPDAPSWSPADPARVEGFSGEMRLLSLVSTSRELSVYKAWPDLELAEYMVREIRGDGYVGIQVKVAAVREGGRVAVARFSRATMRPNPHTWVVVFIEKEGVMDEECLVIPSEDVAKLATQSPSSDSLVLFVHRGSKRTGRVDRYRVALSDLAGRLAEVCSQLAQWSGLPAAARETRPEIKTLEKAVKEHLVVKIRYVDLQGVESTIECNPLRFRYNKAHHVVIWIWNRAEGHYAELLTTGIRGVVMTGEVFES